MRHFWFCRNGLSTGFALWALPFWVYMQKVNHFKVHIFWEGHKILRNIHQIFDWQYIGQIIGGDFAKFCGLLRIYELYFAKSSITWLEYNWDQYRWMGLKIYFFFYILYASAISRENPIYHNYRRNLYRIKFVINVCVRN